MGSLEVPSGDASRGGVAEFEVGAGGSESSLVGQKRSHSDAGSPKDIQSCGICLAEVEDQGVLDCCQHAYCFDCIMKWSQVESRCPTCKRRFGRVTRTMTGGADRRGSLSRPRSFRIPIKDQVYQPSAEDLAAAMEPYANTVCMVCLESDDEHLLLLCDVCDSAAHTYCVGRGRQVPEGDWFCHTCAEADDALTSGSDASVGEEELGESSDSEGDAEEARPRSHQPGGAMTDEDSDTEFLLDIQFDTHPTGAILTRRARRLGSSNSAGAQGPQGGAEGPGRRRRAVRRRGNGRQGQERLSSVPSLDRGGAVGASERGGRREGQVGNSEAASGRWGRGHGSARTLQAQVQDRLQLRLMRERWPAIREGTLHFPSPSPPAPSQQAGPPPASEPKDGAASDSERMAWKALRALQSGEGSMLGRAPVRGGAGQEAKAGAAKKEGGKGIRSRSAPRGPTVPVAERQRAPPPKGLTRSHGDEARNHVHQRTGKSGGQRGAQQRMTADEEGAGGRVAVGALAAFAEARRQANAGWLDDEVLQGLDERPAEGPFAWGQKTGSLAKTFGTQRGSTPHGSWARRPPASETAPPSAVHHDGVLPAGWPACREAGAPSWSAAGAAGEPNWRREGHSERPQAPLGGSSPDQGAQAANVFSGGRRNRAWHDTWRSPSSLPNSRPARLRPPSLPGESGRMAPGTPAPLWPRSPTATGAARPPGPLLTPSCPILAPTVQSAAAPLTAGLSETPDTGEGGRWPTPGRLQAGAREAGEAVVRGGVLLGGTTAPAGGAVAAVERDAHHVQNRASGQAGAGDVVEGENGVTAAKQVKDELAEAVKRQLGPLYKRKVIDRDQFRKVAEGASRALLQMPSAQACYEELKKGSKGANRLPSASRCWCCQRNFEGPISSRLPFCKHCIEHQVNDQLTGLRN